MTSSFTVTSLVVLLLATSLLIAALVTSHWLRIERLNRLQLCGCRQCDCGLWFACSEDGTSSAGEELVSQFSGSGCEWFLSAGFSSKFLPDWFKATQVMATVATVVSVMTLLTGLCSLRGSYKLHGIVTIATTCTAVLLTVAVSVFGAMVSHLEEADILMESFDHLPHLAWSYWLAVASTLMTWISAVCFFLLCRLHRNQYVV